MTFVFPKSLLWSVTQERSFLVETSQGLVYETCHAALFANAVLPRYERVISSLTAQQLEHVYYDLGATRDQTSLFLVVSKVLN